MPRRGSPYGPAYEREMTRLLSEQPVCALQIKCSGAPATTADHYPPVSLHTTWQAAGAANSCPLASLASGRRAASWPST